MKSIISAPSLALIIVLTLFSISCIKVPQFDVMLAESQIEVNENDGNVIVEFLLPDGPRRQDVEVSYRFGGTAKEGKDFTSQEENFVFIPEGTTSNSITINLINNTEQDGQRTIVIAIILVVSNGNTIFQGAQNQSLTILIDDDDCSPYIGGEWDYVAEYYMFSRGDTTRVGQDNLQLEEGVDPQFTGVVSIEDPDNNRKYFITDMLIGMFVGLDIETPCPLHDACGTISGPNDGSVFLMGTLPAYLNGTITNDDTIIVNFEYQDEEETGGGFGHAVLTRR